MKQKVAAVHRARFVLPSVALFAVLLGACAPTITIQTDGDIEPAAIVVTPEDTGTFLFVVVPTPRTGGALEVVRADGTVFHIPPGHFPAPGECRVWDPDLPPGRQSPPGARDDREGQVPAGHYLVYG